MFGLWKRSAKEVSTEASKQQETSESSLQQRMQKGVDSQSSCERACDSSGTGLCGAAAQSKVSDLRSPLLPKLLLLQDMPSERPLLSLYAKEFEKMPIVYIAGPYSAGPERCIGRTMSVAELVLAKCGIPYIPHLTHFWEQLYHKSWDFWIAYDLRLLKSMMADSRIVMLRMEGKSQGADIETLFANKHKIKVFSMEDIKDEGFDFRTSI
jgi:hypothetical protein